MHTRVVIRHITIIRYLLFILALALFSLSIRSGRAIVGAAVSASAASSGLDFGLTNGRWKASGAEMIQGSSGCSGASFAQAAGSPVGAGTDPQGAAVGDFNLDGKPDFAVVNATSANVTIQLGNGAGGFNEPAGSPIGVGAFPLSVAVGDFDLDGKPDLAVANNTSNSVTILLGNGSGGFTQPAGSPIPTGTFTVFIAVGDLNLDGKPDLAVANQNGNVTILLGNGSGGFTQPAGSPFLAGSDSVCVAIGDFNLDGRPDLATANLASDNVTILLGNGSGGFTQAADSPILVELFPNFVAVGDFNTDGKPDLAVANLLSDSVTILLGKGNGGFAEPAGSPVIAGHPDSIAIGDFNLDGKSDLAVTNTIIHNVTILLGDGSGGFIQPAGSPIGAGEIPLYAAIGDFNLDGKPDLAIANQNTNNVTIQLNTCDAFPCSGIGFMQPPGSPVGAESFPASVAVGDFNLDGKPDLAVANDGSDNVTIQLGDGNGGFTQPTGSPVGAENHPRSIAVGDFNQDGKPDLAVATFDSPHGLTILLGNGSGGFTPPAGPPVFVGNFTRAVEAGDFNQDGKPDLAVTNVFSDNVTILLGDGSGGFSEPVGSPVGAGGFPDSVAVGDFNLDSKPDLAVANQDSNNVTILLGNGSGGFTQPAGSPVDAGDGPFWLAVGDFNQDGKPDLTVANANSGNVTILLGNGSGGFDEPAGSPVAAGTTPRSVAVGDFNRDGKPDIAVANFDSDSVAVLLGDGAGGFSEPAGSPVGAGTNPFSVAVGDFNLDGMPDLAAANATSNNVTIQLNNCTAPLTTPGLYGPANGGFFLRNSNTGGIADITFTYGPAGMGFIPLVGDWNGDGVDTIGLYNPATAAFFLRNSNTGGVADITFTYGPAGMGFIPIVGDWDADGVDTIGLYNPAGAAFFLRNSNTGGVADITFTYGPAGMGFVPLAGDWNGDGVDTIGLYNPAGAGFFLRNSNTGGIADITFTYGPAGMGFSALVGDWNGDGVDTIGLYNPAGAAFFLRNSNTGGIAGITFTYGPAGMGFIPIIGDWDGL